MSAAKISDAIQDFQDRLKEAKFNLSFGSDDPVNAILSFLGVEPGSVIPSELCEAVKRKKDEHGLSDDQVLVMLWNFSPDMHLLYEASVSEKLSPMNQDIWNPLSGAVFGVDMSFIDTGVKK